MLMLKRRSARYAAAAGLAMGLTLPLTGCGSGGGNGTFTSTNSFVRSVNYAIPPAGANDALTFYNGVTPLNAGSSASYGQFASNAQYTGVVSSTFNGSATGTGYPTTLGFTTAPTLAANGTPYTLIAAGQSGQTGIRAPQLWLLLNYNTNLPALAAGTNAIRVVNLSQNPNPIGLYTTSNGVPNAPLNAAFQSVPYGVSNAADGGYVIASTVNLQNFALVDATAPQTPLTLSNASNLNNPSFFTAQAYTLFIYGQPGNATYPLTATWIQDYP